MAELHIDKPTSNKHGKSRWRSAILACVTLAAAPGFAHAAGLVFSDDFESGNTNKWVADSGRNKCTVTTSSVDGVKAYGGSNMAVCNWNGTLAWNDPANYTTLKLSSFNYSNEFLLRFRVRYASDVDKVAGNKLLRLYPSDGQNSFYLNAQMEASGGPMFITWETIAGATASSFGGTFWGDGTGFGNGSWHEVEVYIKHNTSGSKNGVVKVWQDGQLKQQLSNITTISSGAKWYPMYLMSNWSNNAGWGHDAGNHVYWDNIEIYSDAGSGASGSMADGTISGGGGTTTPVVPEAPTGLTVQ